MPDISQITLPSGTTYDIKDAVARQAMSSYTKYLGVTTTALAEDATTNPIVIGGESVTAPTGGIATYQKKEFIFNGTKWQEFGDLSSLGALAYKSSASGSYTPAGTVSKPTFTGTAGNVSVSGTPTGSVTLAAATSGTGLLDITPGGTVTQPTFTGTEGTVSVSHAAMTGNISLIDAPAGAGYDLTPAGTVSQPTTTVTLNTTTVNSITAVGSLPSLTTSVENENLTISFSPGTLPTKGSNQTVATTVKSATTTQPTFTGTTKKVVGTATIDAFTCTGSFTPEGTVSQPTFSGTSKKIKATFSGNATTSTGSFTPEGTVSQPTFSGTAATISVS